VRRLAPISLWLDTTKTKLASAAVAITVTAGSTCVFSLRDSKRYFEVRMGNVNTA
jgi:hypothetical protein